MKSLDPYFKEAEKSKFGLWKLNLILWRIIPFNFPHRFKIIQLDSEGIEVMMPFIRKNLNHIRGLHATGLATLCEYICGLQLIRLNPTNDYRIILKTLRMEYRFQAKMEVRVHFKLSPDWFKENISKPLETKDSIVHTFEIEVFDADKNLICIAYPEWQIKPWAKVKTKV